MRHSWKQYAGFSILILVLAGTTGQAQQVIDERAQRLLEQGRQQEERQTTWLVRDEFRELLDNWYPPSMREVLRLDPSLLRNAEYLKSYPKLADFLKEHPDVANNPTFFLGTPGPDYAVRGVPRQSDVGDVVEPIVTMLAFLGALGFVAWVLRSAVDHRRWVRISKLQTEAHSKILERFGSNEDLLTFIQTPAGKRFLESSAIPIEPRSIGAPVGRILWSVQIGFVLLCLGVGMALISYSATLSSEPAQVLFVFGGLVMAMGIGFVLSGLASYTLSKRFGLFDQPVENASAGGGMPSASSS
jgi:hypothetical protein